MAVSIRELGLTDELMVVELLDSVHPDWRNSLAPGASGPRAFMTDPRTFVFGGYIDNDPAGWLWGSHIRYPDGRVMSYVHELDVVERHRRQGLASMMMEAAVGAARRAGSGRLWLVAAVDNDPAIDLYRSLGGRADDADQRLFSWDLA